MITTIGELLDALKDANKDDTIILHAGYNEPGINGPFKTTGCDFSSPILGLRQLEANQWVMQQGTPFVIEQYKKREAEQSKI